MLFNNQRLLGVFTFLGILISIGFVPAVADAQLANPCTLSSVQSFAPADMTIATAIDVAAAGTLPEYCDVTGAVTTTGFGAPDGSAKFEEVLPANWNHKFLYFGCGGLCGTVGHPQSGATGTEGLSKGYAMVATDDGHSASDPTWGFTPNADPTLPGTPKTAALIDYFFRSEHEVAVAAKSLAESYLDGDLNESYFSGCSDGGREGLVEAYRFPDDYDGIIVGDPYQTQRDELLHVDAFAAFNKPSNPGLPIPANLMAMVNQAVYDECDAIDGVKDGLIQDPLRCNFDPASLLCQNGNTSNCLSQAQVNALRTYWSPLLNEEGEMVVPGFPVSDIWPPPTAPFSFVTVYDTPNVFFIAAQTLIQEVYFMTSFNANDYPILGGTIDDRALAQFDAATWDAGNVDPRNLSEFLSDSHHRLLMYDGFSDQGLPPYQTVMFYEDLAGIDDASRDNHGHHLGGLDRIRQQARLFMVPGMEHCGGGPGPNVFDTLTPLENWVEHETPPDAIIASHYTNDNQAQPVDRTMPLCAFPEQAQYSGSGDVNDAANWSCPEHDKTLLKLGTDGVMAGFRLDRHLLQSQFFADEHSNRRHGSL